MPFKNPKEKQQYNRNYHKKMLGKRGAYNTLCNVTYPIILDATEPLCTKNSFQIGRRRVREFKDLLPKEYPEGEGYKIWINRVEGRGIDVKIRRYGKTHTVMELTNYQKTSYLSRKTADRYLKTFRRYSHANRILVVSFDENVANCRSDFVRIGVKIRVMNYQS